MSKTHRQLRAEKKEAFETIVSEYEGVLLRYAARIVRDYNAAQDIVQNTFIRLFRKWEEALRPSPRLLSWLYRVAHNLSVDYVRKETRRHELHKREAVERPDFAAPNRGKGFGVSEAAEAAMGALHTLSLREQQLVILKVFEEKSYREIGEITGLTVSNVGYILHHAMRKMAAELRKNKAIPTQASAT